MGDSSESLRNPVRSYGVLYSCRVTRGDRFRFVWYVFVGVQVSIDEVGGNRVCVTFGGDYDTNVLCL